MSDFEKRLKESKKEIIKSDLNNPKEIYQMCKNNKKISTPKLSKDSFVLKLVICLMVLALAITAIAIKIVRTDVQTEPTRPIINEGIYDSSNTSYNFKTKEELKSYIELQSTKDSSSEVVPGGNSGLEGDYSGVDDIVDFKYSSDNMGSLFVGSASQDAPTYSTTLNTSRVYTTNNRVDGIDEADIVKVKGNYIFYIPGSHITSGVNKCKSMYVLEKIGDDLSIVKTIDFTDEEEEIAKNSEAVAVRTTTQIPVDLYLTEKYLIVKTTVNSYDSVTYTPEGAASSITRSNYRSFSKYVMYDINTLEEVKSIRVPGSNVSTRLIDNDLYVVNNYYDYTNENSSDLYIPRYFVDDIEIEASLEHIWVTPYFGSNVTSYIVVFRINLDTEITCEDFYYLSPSYNKIYATKDEIYLMRTFGNTTEKIENVVTSYSSTRLCIIDIKDEIKLDGVIQVKGNINDQYWIDEYNGYLRIASTGTEYSYKLLDDTYSYGATSRIFNNLYIFEKNSDGNWEIIGSITEGLGEEGETIRSALFNENMATIVTFRNTDPLYCIDLSDPTSPKITSEFKVNGYTVYQHSYLDKYIIGIGYEGNSSGSITGFKIALFDASNKNDIKQVGEAITFLYSEGYNGLPGISDPKALMFDLDNNIFGFSIYNRAWRDTISCHYCVIKIDITEENPLSILKQETESNQIYQKRFFERMVYIGDTYYLLTPVKVYSYQFVEGEFEKVNTTQLS